MYKESIELKIDRDKCIRCGLCVEKCVNRVLSMGKEGGYPEEAEDGGSARCIHCAHCVMICPEGALSIDGISPDSCPAPGIFPDPERMRDLLRGRRSFRHYKRENVPQETLRELLDAMRFSPTGVNNHRLHFAVVDNLESMDTLREYTNSKVLELLEKAPDSAPAMKFAPSKQAILKGEDPIFRRAPHLLLVSSPEDAPCAEIDPIIALSYFELYAQSRNIGTLWCGRAMSAFHSAAPEVFRFLGIPEHYRPGYAMLFGIPEFGFQRVVIPSSVRVSRPLGKNIASFR